MQNGSAHCGRTKTQSDIAALLKAGQRTDCDYELGKTRIPVHSLIPPASFCSVSMDYIVGARDVRGVFPKK